MSTQSDEAISLLPHNELVQKMAKDMYLGNGKPALTVRIALQEDAMEKLQKAHTRFQTLLITTLLSSIGGLLLMVFELVKGK